MDINGNNALQIKAIGVVISTFETLPPDGTCVHCNTMDGIWSGLRNFLDHFKGISQRFLHLRVARYEFLHNHGHLHWRQTFEAALRCIFSTTGDYGRRMTHQHRRMPLSLCYR